MKRLLLLLLMACCLATARSQNITAAEYFIDADPGQGNGIPVNIGTPATTVNFSVAVPSTSLSQGFHFIGLRVRDAGGQWSHFDKRGFYITPAGTNTGNITAAEYFFDADPGQGNGIPINVGTAGPVVNFSLNVPTSLADGFHFLAVRVRNADGQWSHFDKRGFYISSGTTAAADIVAAEYFLDADPGQGNGTPLAIGTAGGTVSFNATIPVNLSPGFHFLAIRVKGSDGKWGHYDKRGFYITTAAVDAPAITAAEFFIDTDPGVGNGTALAIGASGGTVSFNASIPTNLTPGFHFLAVRVKGADGKWGLFEKRGFHVSLATGDAPIITAAEYFIDSDPGVGNGTALPVNTPGNVVIQSYTIPEPGLALGAHRIAIRVKGADGKWGLYRDSIFNIGNSTISCRADTTLSAGTGQCAAVVTNIDPQVSPPQAFTYTLTGATTGSGSGTASGLTFNAGTTTVRYVLTGSPTLNCSFTVTVNPGAPVITAQPQAQSACVGDNVTFSVTGTGSGLSFQWRKNGSNINGATNATLSLNNVTAGDAGNYDVIVSIPCGLSVTSATAALTVGNTAINTQPQPASVCTGSSVTFSVIATGSSLSYQWRKNGNPITGATNASFTISSVSAADAGNYSVVVTGACGSATSANAALSLNAATVINTSPAAQTVCAGAGAGFTVNATGTGVLSYQWKKNGSNISGANAATFSIGAVTAGDAGSYTVEVTSTCGPVLSAAAVLTVNPVTAITQQPANQSSCAGGSVTFTVTATGTGLGYQWRKNGNNISGATAASFTINPVTAGDAASYSVVVTGTCGTVTSANASLSLTAGTVINTQPVSRQSCAGGTASFTVSASGSGTLSYQWKKNGSDIAGANSAAFTLNPVTAGDEASYTVLVTSGCGSVLSDAAALTLLPATGISAQPQSQVSCTGASVSFSVTASGSNLGYQWRKGSVNISGATAATITLNGISPADAGSYDVVISGDCGSVISNAAILSLGTTTISSQPLSRSVCAGDNVSFSVTAGGTALSYQWRKEGVNISGAVSSSFAVTGVNAPDAGSYDVVVTGSCGSVTSSIATLTVNALTVINSQPQAQTVCAGGNASFTVDAGGTSLAFQWRKGGVSIPGATSSSLAINGLSAADAGNYDVVVSGTCGTVIAAAAALTVNAATVINGQPQNQSACAGSNATFSVTAGGAGLSFQWRKGGVNIPGATNSNLTLNSISAADAGSYDVVVTGTCGTVSSATATLTVNTPTAISVQPVAQSLCTGSNAVFSVTATGTNLSYQWRKGGVNITGATNASLTLNGVTTADAGNYEVVVTGTCGTLTSNVVALAVTETGTWTGAADNNWNNPANWCGGVPTPSSNVRIPAGTPFSPVIANGTGSAANITVDAAASLVVAGSGTLELYGSISGSGLFDATGATVRFRGASLQQVPAFSALVVEVDGAGVEPGGNMEITGTLTLTRGYLTLGSHDLRLINSSTGSPASHIVTNGTGKVTGAGMAAGTTFTFPVGSAAGSYTPAVLSAASGHQTDDISVRVVPGVFVNGTGGTLFTEKVVDKIWFITEAVNGGSNLDVSLQWSAADELPEFDRNACYVAQPITGGWEVRTTAPASGTTLFSQRKTGVTALSAFAVQTTPIPKPTGSIYPNPVQDQLNLVIDLPNPSPVTTVVYDAAGRRVIAEEVRLDRGLYLRKFNTSRLAKGVYMVKVSTFYNPNLIVTRFIKE